MREVALVILATAIIAGCGGGKPAATGSAPAVEPRVLTPADSQFSPIVMTVARTLRPGADGKIRFGGIYHGQRELIALSDTVARAIGAEYQSADGRRVPFAICRIGTPGCVASSGDDNPTYTFRHFRIAGATAFVGADAPSLARPDRAVCYSLLWNGTAWEVKEARIGHNAERCGR